MSVGVWLHRFTAERRRVGEPERSREAVQLLAFPGAPCTVSGV